MLKEIIKNMPPIIKEQIINFYYLLPDYIKYGISFNATYSFLQRSERWSEERLRDYQLNKLKELISYSYKNVPYYKKLLDENNILPEDIKDFSDLKKIPYLTKEIIRENLEDLVSKKNNKRKLNFLTTGGTTGIPMGFYEDKKNSKGIERGYIVNLFSRIGYDKSKSYKVVIIRGEIPKTGNYEYLGNNLVLSSFNLVEESMNDYIKMIINFKPDFIQAYPSSISLLSNYILQNNIRLFLKDLKGVICSSENLYYFQRKQIEKAFNTRVYSFYGHTEHSALAGECEKSNCYHLQSEYGYTELINEEGEEAIEENERGEIVCTGFNNFAFPFIRYRTGDVGINSNKKCSCGRNYKIIKKIEGREQDYFIDKSGSKITLTCSDDALWNVKNKIFLYQYMQNEPGKVTLNIQSKREFTKEDEEIVIMDFKKYYPRFEIQLNFTDNIEKTNSGKFRYLVQNIKVR